MRRATHLARTRERVQTHAPRGSLGIAPDRPRQTRNSGRGTPWKSGHTVAAWRLLPAWCKRPDFLAVLLAGAVLRLLWPGSTSFLGDQAQLLAVARSVLDHRAIPLTGIPSSIGTLNPPASIYLLLPFAWLGDPLWAALFTALANVAALVLLYRIADRYAGRLAAFAGGLLYATAAGPVFYARFIWQQNLLAPVLLLFFWTLCRGVVDRRTGWLGWNLVCWGVAVQLHPTAAPLLLLTGIGLLLTRRDLHWRDAAYAAGGLALLFLPTALWLVLSRGSDISHLLASVGGKPSLDATAPGFLLLLMLPALPGALGTHSPYAATYPALGVLLAVVALLAVASTLWLVVVVVRPLLPFATRTLRDLTTRHDCHPIIRDEDPFMGALADPRWRFLMLLALWELAPLAVMLRHSQPVYPHYLLVSLPAAFLALGIFLARVPALWVAFIQRTRAPQRMHWPGWMARQPNTLARRGKMRAHQFVVALVLVLAAALAAAQAAGTMAELVAIRQGAFDARAPMSHYGWPLDDQRAALLAAERAASPLHATVSVASDDLHQQPLGYLATTGDGPASVYDASACLVTPAAGSTPQVTLSTNPGTARDLLQRMPGAGALGTLPSAAGLAPELFRLAPGAALPGETTLPNASTDSSLQLAGYRFDHDAARGLRLVVHWTGTPALAVDPSQALRFYFGAAPQPGAAPVAHYRFLAQPLDAQGHALAAPIVAECSRLAWSSGQSVYAWMTYPSVLVGHVAAWRVSVEAAPFLVTRPSLGPLLFETGAVHEADPVSLGSAQFIPAG